MITLNSNKARLTGTYEEEPTFTEDIATVQDVTNTMTKTGDKQYADVGTIIDYTIEVNTGDLVPTGLNLTDVMDNGLEFIEGSMTLNDVPKTGTPTDLVIDYEPNSDYVIKYQAKKIIAGVQNNVAHLVGVYENDSVDVEAKWTVNDTGNTITKVADRKYVAIGTTVRFTITIHIGDNCPSDLTFSDEMDDGLEFIENSLLVNNERVSGSIEDLVIDFAPNTDYIIYYEAKRVDLGN